MKTSSDYRALAWKELGAHYGKSFLLIVLSSLAVVFLVAIPTAAVYALQDSDWYEAAIGISIVFVFCTLGVLYYYVPAWFLSLKRTSTTTANAHIPYPKALQAGWLMYFPFAIQTVLQSVGKTLGGSYELILGILVLGVSFFSCWWTYAVAIILPFVVQDNKELSLIQATRRSIALMQGHKMDLFKVDMKILLWPMLLLFAMCIGTAVTVAYAKTGEGAAVWALIMSTGTVILMLVMFFAVFPAMQYAHVLFYEDLLAEQQPEAQEE